MQYTGKLIGYTRHVKDSQDGKIIGIDDGVNYELLDQVVEQRPEVIIHVEERKSRLFCTGMISGLYDWERSCVAGTLLVVLMILNHLYGATMENSNEFLFTAITSIAILLAAWTLVGTFACLCSDEDIFHRKWKCIGYGSGFVVGFILLQVLKCYVDFFSVKEFLIAWFVYGCLRVLCAFVRDAILWR